MENFPTIKKISIDLLIPYARNSRTHDAVQVDQIAASIKEFGFLNPIIIDGENGIIAGHGRVMAAKKLGVKELPCVDASHLTDTQRRAYIIADNKLALNAGWDEEMLRVEFDALEEAEFDLELTGFSLDEINALTPDELVDGLTDEDEVPEAPEKPVSVPGDVWILGKHRVMCGDSTVITDVEKLMNGATAQLMHADPPYGMGKEGDGVANDNLYAEELDRFQMDWWTTFRTFLDDNASAYIWGNAKDLWRLWFVGGLGDSEQMELRNEIVWDKKNIAGMASPLLTQYPITTERCLFFQLGNQFLGHVNAEDFPESWELVRGYMEQQEKQAGIGPSDIKNLCGVGMYSHWFTKSQFSLIPEKHYQTLANAYAGCFTKPWKELKAEWDKVKCSEIQDARSYFDNTHDIMRDVWEFKRVTGEERHGHATPKPVEMMERVMSSSLRKGDLVVEPFGGSGSTLIGAEKTGRACYSMEMQPVYVDVIVRRWQNFTGKEAVHIETGKTYNEMKQERENDKISE